MPGAYPFSFDPEQPFGIPSPQDVLASAREWVEENGESTQRVYFSAEGEAMEDGPYEQDQGEAATPQARRRRAKPAAPGQERPSAGAKKPTVATLASSLEQLMSMNEGFSKNLEALTLRQMELEKRLIPAQLALNPGAALHQPISQSLMSQTGSLANIAKTIGTPPRTAAPMASGLLSSPCMRPSPVQELEEEKRPTDLSSSSDPLAKAVLAQSQAPTALVSQIAQQSSDPMLDLSGSSSSAGTRGAIGRARLQAELASQKGTFFNAVLAAMARRMYPTASAEGSPQELMDRGVCGTRYLERFGGFGKLRDLGCLQHQVMSILDCLQTSNLQAARDQTALLAVTLDQAALDSGRFDLAQLLCLQEEPPSTVFTNRQANVLSKQRAFSPLADQKWITVALAYIKELDVITSKRLELTNQSRPGTLASSSTGEHSGGPKAKAQPKKKNKGGGKGSQQSQGETEDT